MQGTFLMLVALSGLGCHNKSADMVFAPPAYGCYGGGSYASIYAAGVAPSCFSSCYATSYSGCFGGGCYGGGYGGCYSSCYSGLYSGGYGGHHGCGLLSRLFSCCGWKSHYSSCYGGGYLNPGYSSAYGMGGGYEPAIFGYALQYNYPTDSDQVVRGQ